MESLSNRQKEVFETLRDYIETHGYPPSMRDLAKKLGIINPTAIKRMLDIFKEQGLLEKVAGKSRTIQLKSGFRPSFGDVISLPIAGRIVAGNPKEAIQEAEEHVSVPSFLAHRNAGSFLLKVTGDSMEPELHQDDLVVIVPQSTANPNDLVVAMIEDEATVKQLLMQGREMILHPLNPRYPDIPVNREFQLIGKVSGLIRKF